MPQSPHDLTWRKMRVCYFTITTEKILLSSKDRLFIKTVTFQTVEITPQHMIQSLSDHLQEQDSSGVIYLCGLVCGNKD